MQFRHHYVSLKAVHYGITIYVCPNLIVWKKQPNSPGTDILPVVRPCLLTLRFFLLTTLPKLSSPIQDTFFVNTIPRARGAQKTTEALTIMSPKVTAKCHFFVTTTLAHSQWRWLDRIGADRGCFCMEDSHGVLSVGGGGSVRGGGDNIHRRISEIIPSETNKSYYWSPCPKESKTECKNSLLARKRWEFDNCNLSVQRSNPKRNMSDLELGFSI